MVFVCANLVAVAGIDDDDDDDVLDVGLLPASQPVVVFNRGEM